MKILYRTFQIIALSFILIAQCKAVPAIPYPVKITQPDGSVITIQLHGDEKRNYKTTTDGFLLTENNQGIHYYAEFNPVENKIVSTRMRAHDTVERTDEEINFVKKLTPHERLNLNELNETDLQPRFAPETAYEESPPQPDPQPVTGSPKCLVLLVNFTDMRFTIDNPQESFNNLMNQQGYSQNGATGSVRDYFTDSSTGQFTPEFVVLGPFDLPKNRMFYNSSKWVDGRQYAYNTSDMVAHACSLAVDKGHDLSIFDNNNDGYIDHVSVIYAGLNRAEGGPSASIWPHRANMPDPFTKIGDKRLWDYMCTSELKGSSGANMCAVGTFIHEFSHILGLKDYYSTSESVHHTLSFWSVMDRGPYLNEGRTPPVYCAFDRFFMGWLTPVELKEPQRGVTLNPLNESNTAYLVTEAGNHNMNAKSPSPIQYFTLENRQNTGWDKYLPGHGLLITRVYYYATNWNNNNVNSNSDSMGFDIIEADGIASDETLAGDSYPGANNIFSCDLTLRNGTNINKPLALIRENEGVISFRFMVTDAPDISVTGDLIQFTTTQGTPADEQYITANCIRMQSPLTVSVSENSHFELKLENEDKWSKSVSIPAIDNTIDNKKVLVRYNPTEPSFDELHTETLKIEADDSDPLFFALKGSSDRPVYVVPPVALKASNISRESFKARWEEVNDATGYYLSMYTIKDSESEIKEGFDTGLDINATWETNITNTTVASNHIGESAPALRMEQDGNYITTEEYLTPVTELSFHAKSITGQGEIIVEGFANESWTELERIKIDVKLGGTQTVHIQESYDIRRIRITFSRKSGSLALDDISLKFKKTPEFTAENFWITETEKVFDNLTPEQYYYYRVRASDKTMKNFKILYENITNYSNMITVFTVETDGITYNMSDNNDWYKILNEDKDIPIHIYTITGQKIKSVFPDNLILELKKLSKQEIYIIQKGNITLKTALND